MRLIYLFLQYPTVILWQIIKAAGKHYRLLSHDHASMAVYCEQEVHTKNIRGGSVLVVYRDDDIEIQMRTTRIPISDCLQKIASRLPFIGKFFAYDFHLVMQPKILTNGPKRKIAYVKMMRIKRGFGVHVQSSKLVLLAFLGITMPSSRYITRIVVC